NVISECCTTYFIIECFSKGDIGESSNNKAKGGFSNLELCSPAYTSSNTTSNSSPRSGLKRFSNSGILIK
ncbi:hypothetical protein, partial [Helicobacter suis]|uniref:hypothetical protein n=1 Tax=Helicobacter suis TaxID=104628 RepID=UPI001F168ABF